MKLILLKHHASRLAALDQVMVFYDEMPICQDISFELMQGDRIFLQGSLRDYAETCGVEESLFMNLLRKLDFSREHFEKPMETYSEGQKKKVLIARSLCEQAHLYIWDEPLNFIDVYSRMQNKAAR